MNALLLPLLAGLLMAPQLTDADRAALLADDLRFAEGLARFRLFDLSRDVVSDVQGELEDLVDDDLAGETALIEARILFRQSESTSDPDLRLRSQTEAIEALTDWTRPGSRFAFHERLTDALYDLALLHRQRGQDFAREAAATGDDDLRDRAEADFRAAEAAYEGLAEEAEARAEQFEGLGQEDGAEGMRNLSYNTLYWRGINAIEWADVSADPELRLEGAIENLDDFQWEIPDDTLFYYQAMYEQGRAYYKLSQVVSDPEDAEDLLADARDVLDSALELAGDYFWYAIDQKDENGQAYFSDAYKERIGSVFDQIWGYRAVIEAEQGNLSEAREWIATLESEHETKNVNIGRTGHRVLLDWAETLADLGSAGEATRYAKLVADAGRGTPEGDRAEQLLAGLVGGGAQIQAPDVLVSVARGHLTNNEYDDAAFQYLRAAAAISTDEDRTAYAYDAWMGAGDALTRLNRSIEAALAYSEALDIEIATRNDMTLVERAALRMYTAYDRRYRATQHAFDKALRDQASQRLLDMGIARDLVFLKAQEAFSTARAADDAGDEGAADAYLAALDEFDAVPDSSESYERAMVFKARCLNGAGRIDEALAAFADIRARFADPALTPTSSEGRTKREIAMAEARYNEADLLLDESVDRPADALDVLEGFEVDVPTQVDFHPLVKFLRVRAHADLAQSDEAEQILQQLLDDGAASDTLVSGAAFYVARALEAEARTHTDPAAFRARMSRAADAMWIHSERGGHSRSVNLLSSGDWYLDAEQTEDARRAYETFLDMYGDGGAPASQIEAARMGLARSYDLERDFGRARALWNELLADNPNSVGIRRGAARSFGGWLEMDDAGQVLEIPGSGDFEEALSLWTDLFKGLNVNNRYTRAWWEAKISSIYALYRMRDIDPEKGRMGRKVFESQKLSTPGFDRDTMDRIDEQDRYEDLFQPLFRYLDRQLPPL